MLFSMMCRNHRIHSLHVEAGGLWQFGAVAQALVPDIATLRNVAQAAVGPVDEALPHVPDTQQRLIVVQQAPLGLAEPARAPRILAQAINVPAAYGAVGAKILLAPDTLTAITSAAGTSRMPGWTATPRSLRAGLRAAQSRVVRRPMSFAWRNWWKSWCTEARRLNNPSRQEINSSISMVQSILVHRTRNTVA